MKDNHRLINHERIHLRQQLEMLIIPFYIWYISEYFIRLIISKNRKEAYRNICFEKEAYSNESDTNYLENRPFWNFTKFIGEKK